MLLKGVEFRLPEPDRPRYKYYEAYGMQTQPDDKRDVEMTRSIILNLVLKLGSLLFYFGPKNVQVLMVPSKGG